MQSNHQKYSNLAYSANTPIYRSAQVLPVCGIGNRPLLPFIKQFVEGGHIVFKNYLINEYLKITTTAATKVLLQWSINTEVGANVVYVFQQQYKKEGKNYNNTSKGEKKVK